MKTTSRFAIAAAASVLATSAMAADLGGNCCADLEERVAELEATTARKGNRRVSLTVYGQVNEGLLWWDDGEESNVYVVTNNNGRSRFGFRGDARISPEWSAGYLLEIGVQAAISSGVSQNVDDPGPVLDIRHSAWYLDSNRLGRVWVGQTSSATDGITEINLANAAYIGSNDPPNWNGAFFLRPEGAGPGIAGESVVTWRNIYPQWNANVGEGDRRNLVRYVSPTFTGFTFSAAWGEDDFWDAALRYANEFNGVRVAFGIGYQWYGDTESSCANLGHRKDEINPAFVGTSFASIRATAIDCEALGLSGSVMHVPTGLYVHGAYGYAEDNNRRELFAREVGVYGIEDRDEHWYFQAGVERNWFGIGKTTVYGEYFHSEMGGGLSSGLVRIVDADDPLALGFEAIILGADVDIWGFGLVQTIDAAAMDLYIGYRTFEADVRLLDEISAFKTDIQDFQAVFAGGIIRF
ncbi:MAG: porin [Hyphomicrobiaceae bacterium]|nr:porin [Hyphomicrobiaceae bacterium]